MMPASIMPKDQITISVNTTTPEASLPFNLLLQNSYVQGRSMSVTGGTLMPYLVDNEGNINFPIVGKLKVGGLTKSEAERLVTEKIRPYLAETENPVVTVTMASYSVSVLGEVNRPGSFQVSREKITILEALAQAGDLTIYGVRDRVKLIREDANGQKSVVTLNLNDANIINSPYYIIFHFSSFIFNLSCPKPIIITIIRKMVAAYSSKRAWLPSSVAN